MPRERPASPLPAEVAARGPPGAAALVASGWQLEPVSPAEQSCSATAETPGHSAWRAPRVGVPEVPQLLAEEEAAGAVAALPDVVVEAVALPDAVAEAVVVPVLEVQRGRSLSVVEPAGSWPGNSVTLSAERTAAWFAESTAPRLPPRYWKGRRP